VRRAGEDLAENDLALPQGALLHAGEIGLLAALGRTLVEVHRRPLVAIVSTGDELVPPDRPLLPGQIVGSNAHALAALVSEAGGVPRVLPIAPDHREALRATFAEALRADVVVSSGGVSVGEFDFVKQTLLDLGVEERFWRVAMKPGKPLSFGVRPASASAHQVPVFGLPGNPASAMVSFLYFVRPALRRLLGLSAEQAPLPRARVRLSGILRPDEKRLHITRARVERDQSGALVATPGGQQGSGMLRSMVGVNALLEIQPGPVPLAAGAEVIARLLSVV
jgi:molybdopterin molybdotransferase